MADLLYPITVPKWGIEMQEGTITGWHIGVGAAVDKGGELVDIETDKIVNSMEAPVSGIVCRQLAGEGETLKVGELLGVIATGDAGDDDIDAFVRDFVPADASFGADDDLAPTGAAGAESDIAEVGTASLVRASPVAKRVAKQLGVDLSNVKGTGRNGRISKEDVEAAAAGGPDITEDGPTVEAMSSQRLTIARRLVASKQEIPHYYLTRTIAVDNVMATKTAGISLNAIILNAVAKALGEHPNVNVHVHEKGIERRQSIDINVAIDTERGLSAPLITNVDQLELDVLTQSIATLGERARGNQLVAADLKIGGFTVSNLGAMGIESFTAIINPPQAAILAIGAVYATPLVRDGSLFEEQRIRVTLSCDHRVIDGADGARFLQSVAQLLED